MKKVKGSPQPFGAVVKGNRVNFAVQVPQGKTCELLLYRAGRTLPEQCFEMAEEDGIGEVRFLAIEDIDAGKYEYNYKIGEKICVDPYVREVAGKEHFGTETERSFINDKFPACPNISIDFAVMEKTPNVFVSCVNFGWNDLGTWGVLYEYSPKSKEGNVSQNCNAMLYNCHNNMIAAKPGKLIVASGLKNFIVADSDDVLLICPQSEEQRIKQYVNDVKSSFGDKYL